MLKTLKRIIYIALLIIGLIIIYFGVIIIINSIHDYHPNRHLLIDEITNENDTIPRTYSYSIVSWNIGYGGLGKDDDFFYDGGQMVRPDKGTYITNWEGIQKSISEFTSRFDFILLQEVDQSSYRSYDVNQHFRIRKILKGYEGIFVKNYSVSFVPLPLFKPMGNVTSGLSSFSRHPITRAEVIPFKGNYAWPKSLMMPDRCFLTTSNKLASGKRLHIINTHNSAFDDGTLRKEQIKVLLAYMDSLYGLGDYVVAGGDWNINPPFYENKAFRSKDIAFKIEFDARIFTEYPGWNVLYDNAFPTNRDVSSAYVKGTSPTTIIDFFICSPNIKTLNISTLYEGFRHSDHHAVALEFVLH